MARCGPLPRPASLEQPRIRDLKEGFGTHSSAARRIRHDAKAPAAPSNDHRLPTLGTIERAGQLLAQLRYRVLFHACTDVQES